MSAVKRLSIERALNSLLLALLLMSTLIPAHFSLTATGQWADVCTSSGLQSIWQNDVTQSATPTSAITPPPAAHSNDDGKQAHIALMPSKQINCPWCLFALPAFVILALSWFFIAVLSYALTQLWATRLIYFQHLWQWASPRAPPALTFT